MHPRAGNKLRARRAAAGFTLIELMVVVGIVAILTAIAYSSYSNHIVKTRRAAATACLVEMTHYMERFRTTNLTYAGADTNTPEFGCEKELEGFYDFSLSGVNDRTFQVQATPLDAQASRDTHCGVLAIDQVGTRTVDSVGGPVAEQCM